MGQPKCEQLTKLPGQVATVTPCPICKTKYGDINWTDYTDYNNDATQKTKKGCDASQEYCYMPKPPGPALTACGLTCWPQTTHHLENKYGETYMGDPCSEAYTNMGETCTMEDTDDGIQYCQWTKIK